jgi:cytochrome b6-f complex iron-sulfur subunit
VAACGALWLGGCNTGGPIDGSVTPTNGMALIPFAMFPALNNVGDGVVIDVDGAPIAVIRTGATTASALSAKCTHQGCTVEVQAGDPQLTCPCHGSTFSINGAVIQGPARTALRTYAATVGSDGVTVAIG